MGKKEDKTNVMRILDALGVSYECYTYDNTALNAAEIARLIGAEQDAVFKTLVTVGRSGQYYVFMVRSAGELDLKKAARAAGEKSIEMIPQKNLLPQTGYIHGGCSPIGMKKQYATFIDRIAEQADTICFSGGKPGYQVRVTLSDLCRACPVKSADIAVE